jgi:hypothetical protein
MIFSQRVRVPGGQQFEMGFLAALYTFGCHLIIVYETRNGSGGASDVPQLPTSPLADRDLNTFKLAWSNDRGISAQGKPLGNLYLNYGASAMWYTGVGCCTNLGSQAGLPDIVKMGKPNAKIIWRSEIPMLFSPADKQVPYVFDKAATVWGLRRVCMGPTSGLGQIV